MSYIDKISVGGTVYDIQDSNAAPQTEVDELKSAMSAVYPGTQVPMGDGVYRNASTITIPTLSANKPYRIDILPSEDIATIEISVGSLSNAGREQSLGSYAFTEGTVVHVNFTAADAWTLFRISNKASIVSVTVYDNNIATYFENETAAIREVETKDTNAINSQISGGAFSDLTWERGSISDTTGDNSTNNARIRCGQFYAPKGSTVTVDSSSYEYWAFKYDLLTGAYTKVMTDYATYGATYTADEDCMLRVVMKIANSTADIPAADVLTVASHIVVTLVGIIKRIKDNTNRIDNPLYYCVTQPSLALEAGKSINPSTGADDTNANRARTQNYIDGKNRITVSVNTGYSFVVQHYYNDTTEASSWLTSYNNDAPTGVYRFAVRKGTGGSAFTEQDVIDCGLTVNVTEISNNLQTFLSKKVDVHQPDNAGKFLYVNSYGEVSAINISFDPTAPVHVRVGTYNIGHYSEGQQTPAGTVDNAINFRKAISDMDVSLLGTNENDVSFDAAGTMTPRDMVFANWKYYNVGPLQQYSCNGFASDYAITNVGKIEFPQTTRYCWYCDMDIGGKSVHVVSAHLDFRDITQRRAQIATIIAHCADYDRCIVMGDFNPFNYTDGSYNDDGNDESVWETDYALWTTAGYKLANDGYLGKMATIVRTAVSGWEGMPCDNIIVSSGIEIRSIGMISMEYMQDHRPIWAELVIY